MDKINSVIDTNRIFSGLMLAFLLFLGTSLVAQNDNETGDELMEAEEEIVEKIRYKDKRNARNSFNSIWIMDQQTPLVPIKGTWEMDIQHRFGTFLNGWEDFIGIYASSNVRIAMGYVPVRGLMVGFGLTRDRMQMDFNAKYAIYEQKQDGFPMSITYYGNMSLETRKKQFYTNGTDRLSYFHQLIFASKVCDYFSLLVAPSISWFNNVEGFINDEGDKIAKRNNEHIAISAYGRFRINSKLSIMLGYDQPLTKHRQDNPNPNISIGLEMSTSSHSFQVTIGNYRGLVPQGNHFFNNNDYRDGAFLLGFNITRLWN